MVTADEQIRVSEAVKRELDRRRRANESYNNDVLERLFNKDWDFLAGHGMLSDEQAEQLRDQRRASKQTSKDRVQRLVDDG